MTTYYKATRPDGTSFHDGKTKWEVGKTTRRPKGSPNDFSVCGPSVIHAADAPAETLVGGSWPCRLFEVEGTPVVSEGNKFGFKQLKVVKELPAHLALGPNGEEVAALIERAKTITPEQAERLRAARAAARDAAWSAALALVVRDLISEEHFNALYGPWKEVMEG